MEAPAPLPLIATGIPNLDLILGGGVPRGDVLLVVGPAGAGKTTLSFQMLFHAATAGQNVVYVATLSEPPTKLLRHLRSYAFYDEALVGKRLFLLNVYPLITQSLDAVSAALLSAVREHRATIIVVDGLMTIHDLHPASTEFRRFVYELGTSLAAEGCTTVVTSGETPRSIEYRFPEYTMADGVVELGTLDVGTRTERTLRVRKLRGLDPLLGQQSLRIDDAGLTAFPRLESAFHSVDVGLDPARVPLGISELDALMHGGPHANTVTVLAGALGTGKTLTCLQFLMEGARRGEKGLFLGFRETPRQLIDKARAFGLDLAGAIDRGTVEILRRAPVDLAVDQVSWELRDVVRRLRPRRLALDSIAELERGVAANGRANGYMAALGGLLQNQGVTALVTKEIPQVIGPELDFSDTPLATLAENLILYRWVEFRSELIRIVSILKMRDSPYDSSIRQYRVTDAGIHVLEKAETAEGLLTGVARLPVEARRRS